MDQYYSLFPIRGDLLQCRLATATFSASMKSAIFPVIGGKQTNWVSGPMPFFFSQELDPLVQRALVADGMRLVSLPPELLQEYEQALGKQCNRLGGEMLADFLTETWKKKYGDKN